MLSRINVTCLVCTSIVKRDSFQKHVEEVCPISCPNDCGVLQTRAGVKKHLEICTHHIVPCEAVVVGCSFIGKRFEIEDHQLKCSVNAQKPLLMRIQILEEKLQKQDKVIEELLHIPLIARTRTQCLEIENAKQYLFNLYGRDGRYPLISAILRFDEWHEIEKINSSLSEIDRRLQWATLDISLFMLSDEILEEDLALKSTFKLVSDWIEWIKANNTKYWFKTYEKVILDGYYRDVLSRWNNDARPGYERRLDLGSIKEKLRLTTNCFNSSLEFSRSMYNMNGKNPLYLNIDFCHPEICYWIPPSIHDSAIREAQRFICDSSKSKVEQVKSYVLRIYRSLFPYPLDINDGY
jgi:hypothetical protein